MKGSPLFGQMLNHIPTSIFSRVVHRHQAERNSKGLSSWTHLVAMLFCHLARADSLREICNGLMCGRGKLNHLGIKNAPPRSTLSYANAHRPAAMFEDLFFETLDHFRKRHLWPTKHKFRFKNHLMSLDSTTITLCANLFPWARYRRAKGGVKVHVLLDHADYLPAFVAIGEAREHDRIMAGKLRLAPDSIVVADRAYIDFKLLKQWDDEGVFFVVRLKEGTQFCVPVPTPVIWKDGVISDETIHLTGAKTRFNYPGPLRLVTVWDSRNGKVLRFVTNLFDLSASTISDIYRERWQIELFFKQLKQTLVIRTFIGTSENAVRI